MIIDKIWKQNIDKFSCYLGYPTLVYSGTLLDQSFAHNKKTKGKCFISFFDKVLAFIHHEWWLWYVGFYIVRFFIDFFCRFLYYQNKFAIICTQFVHCKFFFWKGSERKPWLSGAILFIYINKIILNDWLTWLCHVGES